MVLIDQRDSFVFGFSKLDVMFGRALAADVRLPYRDALKARRAVRPGDRGIDRPGRPGVETTAGAFEGDVLVVALGATSIRRPRRACWRAAATSSTASRVASPRAT